MVECLRLDSGLPIKTADFAQSLQAPSLRQQLYVIINHLYCWSLNFTFLDLVAPKSGEIRDTKTLNLSRNIVSFQVFARCFSFFTLRDPLSRGSAMATKFLTVLLGQPARRNADLPCCTCFPSTPAGFSCIGRGC